MNKTALGIPPDQVHLTANRLLVETPWRLRNAAEMSHGRDTISRRLFRLL
jgi:hypothetical protein